MSVKTLVFVSMLVLPLLSLNLGATAHCKNIRPGVQEEVSPNLSSDEVSPNLSSDGNSYHCAKPI